MALHSGCVRQGPDTDASNPGVTLFVLDASRFTPQLNANARLDAAADCLLDHWTVRKPMGPCEFAMGTLFMQTEYPFVPYDLFFNVYVLSLYDRAKRGDGFWKPIMRCRANPPHQQPPASWRSHTT